MDNTFSVKQMAYKLRALRIYHGYSVRYVSEKIGWAASSILRWEKAQGAPKASAILEICRFYNISINQFYGSEKLPYIDDCVNENESLFQKYNKLLDSKTKIEKEIKDIEKDTVKQIAKKRNRGCRCRLYFRNNKKGVIIK